MFRWFKNLFRYAEEIDDVTEAKEGTLLSDTVEGRLYELIEANECPDCHHHDGFYEGPSGGLSTNVECVNCHHWFNITPVVGIAERIG